ncbi:MAG: cytidine deaminase [Firmicutes bacterium]|nr:cytidine deaminase [Bacillota bacterium]
MKDIYNIDEKYKGGKRENILTKDELVMLQAILTSLQSKDPSTQVGACYVNEKGEIISKGYNHQIKYWDENDFPWNGDVSNNGEENTKYPYMIHAEMDGLINYKGNREEFINSTLYVTLYPCSNCAKHAIEAGVKKIVYLYEREENLDKIITKRMFNSCNIECVSFNEITNNLFEGIEINTTNDEKHTVKILVKDN